MLASMSAGGNRSALNRSLHRRGIFLSCVMPFFRRYLGNKYSTIFSSEKRPKIALRHQAFIFILPARTLEPASSSARQTTPNLHLSLV